MKEHYLKVGQEGIHQVRDDLVEKLRKVSDAGASPFPPQSFTVPGRSVVRHPNSIRFHQILEELGALHDKKSFDYGNDKDPLANVRASEEFGIPAWVGAVIRLNDKVVRLKSYARKGELKNESAEDSMRDIAVYAIIALILYENETAKQQAIVEGH